MVSTVKRVTLTNPFITTSLIAVLLFFPFTALKLTMGKGKRWLFTSDGFYYYSYAVSLVLDKDVDFTNQYRFSRGVGNPKDREKIVPETGRPTNAVGIGCALLWMPGFLLGHGLAKLAIRDGTPNGYELVYQVPTYFWSFLVGLFGLWLLYRLLEEMFTPKLALLTTVGILFGTALSNYAFMHANMAHWTSAATAVAYLYAVYRLHQQPRSIALWIASGALLGVSAMVRYQNAALTLLLFGVVWELIRERAWKELLVGITSHVIATFVVFVPQMLAWKAIYGSWLTNPYGSYGARVIHFAQEIPWNFSYLFWLFLWSPLLLLGIYGMTRPMPEVIPKLLVVGVALALLAQLHVNLSMPEIGGYGVRRMTDFFPYFGLGIANALRVLEQRWGSKASIGAIAAAVVYNWSMLAFFYLNQIHSDHFRFG